MKKHARFLYQPVAPLGKGGRMVTGCDAHWKLCKEAAAEGTVLLKNDGTLPLQKGAKVSLFGVGAGDFIFGGGGSGVVVTDRKITLHEGLQASDFTYFAAPGQFCQDAIEEMLAQKHKELPTVGLFSEWRRNYQMELPELPEDLYQQAVEFGGTAIFCISRYSAEGDNGGDRSGKEGDFYLWESERKLLDRLCKDFDSVVVVINSCGPVAAFELEEDPKISAVLYTMYSGGVGGEVICEML